MAGTANVLRQVTQRVSTRSPWTTAGFVGMAVVLSIAIGWAIADGRWIWAALVLAGIAALLLLRPDPFVPFCMWLLAASFVERMVGLSFGAGLPDINFDRTIIALILFSVLLRLVNRRIPIPRVRPEDQALTAFVLVWLFALVRAKDLVAQTVLSLGFIGLPIAIFFLTRVLINSRERLRLILLIAGVVGGFQALAAMWEAVTGASVIGWQVETVTRSGFVRPGAFQGGTWTLATLLSMLVPIVLYLLHLSSKRIGRLSAIACLMILLIAILQTTIRASWLSTLLSLLLLLVLSKRERRFVTLVLVIGAIMVVLLWPRIENSEILRDRITSPRNLSGRVTMLEYQVRVWTESPLWGQGAGYGLTAEYGLGFTTSHNTFGSLLVDAGLFGMIPYVLAIGLTVWRSVRLSPRLAREDPFGYTLMVTLWAGILVYMINAWAIDMRGNAFVTCLFWMYLGLIGQVGSSGTNEGQIFQLAAVPVSYCEQEKQLRGQHCYR